MKRGLRSSDKRARRQGDEVALVRREVRGGELEEGGGPRRGWGELAGGLRGVGSGGG